ncbi:HesA/MoeB/ThiF family protein [Crocosphaera sp. XPORK-15E]|uniref:HesA/MoeB/ThiF family protein n=1 Tax=Crocosphaera sp. XPORK-15E TaxID=3110247 RepID=UPI002B2153FE|nr:HesA/MoeB/ThiF family protein [Crocosphaera sp. XPORK-15E]MEA5533395.1 HesA/MoeB/ThiF family protein [Crocosphaera sp. XPORK-15E]
MEFTPTELERYSRQIQLPGFGEEGQKRLKDSTAVVTGVGGLGGTVALYLAVAGVGKIILVRGGDLRLDDLNRQILMTNSWVGQPRVFKAKETLLNINPEIYIEAVHDFVTPENVDALVQQADIAFDCAFDFKERDLLNAACVRWGVPMVEAAMSGMDAYLTTIIPGETPCLSCIFPEKPDWDRWGFGVLGAVSGSLACLAALEGIKLLTGLGEPLTGQLLTMDLGTATFAKRRPYHDPNCPVCGNFTRQRLANYVAREQATASTSTSLSGQHFDFAAIERSRNSVASQK